jgi:hypothetical protein
VVERCRTDPHRFSEIVFSALHGFLARRQAALIRPQDGPRGYVQNQRIDGRGAKGQVWMSAAPVGQSVPMFVAVVRTRSPLSDNEYSMPSLSEKG